MFKNILLTSNLLKLFPTKNQLSFRFLSAEANDVIIESVNDKGILTLNRPKALNSLDLSMVKKIVPTLIKWEKEKSLVLVKGTGDKSFCSGADVKSIVIANIKGEKLGQEFFKREYAMNGIIGTYKIPYIAFIDGIVMGGGVGISVHGQYRIATERTLFAMPETQIALFPDVGCSYVLPRLEGKLGIYLALTGTRLEGYDVVKAGIATHYIDSKALPKLEQQLLNCNNFCDINGTLETFAETKNVKFSLAPHMEKINEYFAADSVECIMQNLKCDDSEWAQATYKLLMKMSPTSMKVTKELLKRGSKLELHECLQMEYNVACNTLDQHDFNEGVRALLIDKDKSPKWNPATLEEVSSCLVEKHFDSVPDGLNQEFRNKS